MGNKIKRNIRRRRLGNRINKLLKVNLQAKVKIIKKIIIIVTIIILLSKILTLIIRLINTLHKFNSVEESFQLLTNISYVLL